MPASELPLDTIRIAIVDFETADLTPQWSRIVASPRLPDGPPLVAVTPSPTAAAIRSDLLCRVDRGGPIPRNTRAVATDTSCSPQCVARIGSSHLLAGLGRRHREYVADKAEIAHLAELRDPLRADARSGSRAPRSAAWREAHVVRRGRSRVRRRGPESLAPVAGSERHFPHT